MAVSDNNTRIMITVPKEFKIELEELAKRDNRSLSNLIVTVLQEKLKTIKDDK